MNFSADQINYQLMNLLSKNDFAGNVKEFCVDDSLY